MVLYALCLIVWVYQYFAWNKFIQQNLPQEMRQKETDMLWMSNIKLRTSNLTISRSSSLDTESSSGRSERPPSKIKQIMAARKQ